MKHRGFSWALGPLLFVACGERKAVTLEQPPSSVKGPLLEAEGPRWTRVLPLLPPEPEADDPSLRRSYGLADMQLGACTRRAANGTLTGAGCPKGCVVFGPYVRVPKNSDVRVSFQLRAVSKLDFSSDVVSNAKLTHGALDAQAMAAGQTRQVAYRVHLSEAAQAIEARVWVSADGPSAFEIANFSVAVQ